MNARTTHEEVILIGGGELGRCPTRIHHDRYNRSERIVDPVIKRRIADGHAWEDTVVTRLLEGTDFNTISTLDTPLDSTQPVVVPSGVSRSERESITTEALSACVPLIVGARLSAGSLQSVGVPDLLLRLDEGYAPV